MVLPGRDGFVGERVAAAPGWPGWDEGSRPPLDARGNQSLRPGVMDEHPQVAEEAVLAGCGTKGSGGRDCGDHQDLDAASGIRVRPQPLDHPRRGIGERLLAERLPEAQAGGANEVRGQRGVERQVGRAGLAGPHEAEGPDPRRLHHVEHEPEAAVGLGLALHRDLVEDVHGGEKKHARTDGFRVGRLPHLHGQVAHERWVARTPDLESGDSRLLCGGARRHERGDECDADQPEAVAHHRPRTNLVRTSAATPSRSAQLKTREKRLVREYSAVASWLSVPPKIARE
jgi:hypothetical protein